MRHHQCSTPLNASTPSSQCKLQPMSLQLMNKTIPIRDLTLDVTDVRRIVTRLIPYVDKEGEREINHHLEVGPDTQEYRNVLQLQRQEAYRITVTIDGRDGERLIGHGIEPFDSPSMPESVVSVFISNVASYQAVTGRTPANKFTLSLDFSAPPLLDGDNPVSSPTTNHSNLSIEGDHDAWVASISHVVLSVLERKSNSRNMIHAPFAYDIGLFLVGLPMSFYLCWRLSNVIEMHLGAINAVLSGAAYIYVVLVTLFGYRILFGYTKWAFPTMELVSNEGRSRRHRRFWYTLLVGLVVSGLYDLLG